MADLSQYSDQDLLAIANGGMQTSATDLSDSELMQIAGVKPIVRQPVADNRPGWLDSAKQVGKDIGEGAFEAIPALAGLVTDAYRGLGREATKFNESYGHKDPTLTPEQRAEMDDTFKTTREWTQAAKGAFDSIFGNPADTVQGTAHDIEKAAVQAAVMPGNPVTNAISGIGSETAHKIAPDSDIAPFVGAMAGPLTAGTAVKAAEAATSTGKAFERASVGAGTKDYLRSQKFQGLLEDSETGESLTRLKQAINEIGDSEGWGVNRTPETLQERVQNKLTEYGGKIGDMTAAADSQSVQASLPFANTQKLISGATASKASLKQGFDEFIDAFTHPIDGWDGTIAGLRKWSTDIRDLGFSGQATGQMPANVSRTLQRSIGQDLQASVKDAMLKAGFPKEEIDAIYRQYSNYSTVAPVIAQSVVKGESGTAASALRGLLRTSGGTLTTPTLIMSTLGGATAGPTGLLAGAALGSLASPTGAGIAGSTLKKIGSVVGEATKAVPAKGSAVMATPIGAQSILGGDSSADSGTKRRDNKINSSTNKATDMSEANQNPAEAEDKGNFPPKIIDNGGKIAENMDHSLSILSPAPLATPSAFTAQRVPANSLDILQNGPTDSELFNRVFGGDMEDPTIAKLQLVQMQAESAGDPNAVSSKGATGLYQFMPKTWAEWAPKAGYPDAEMTDPVAQEAVYKAYMQHLLSRFGDPRTALAAYNYGPTAVTHLLEQYGRSFEAIYPHLPHETKNYVDKISAALA